MFFTIGNKRFMSVKSARAYAYKMVRKTGKSVDLTRITAKGPADAGTVLTKDGKVFYTPLGGMTYALYADGSVKS